jgi:hypothetical protein
MWCNTPLWLRFSTGSLPNFMEGHHMSRVVTPPTAKPASPQVQIPHDKIAKRAYEKWVQRGQPHGTDIQDWLEAEAELRSELTRTTGHGPTRR